MDLGKDYQAQYAQTARPRTGKRRISSARRSTPTRRRPSSAPRSRPKSPPFSPESPGLSESSQHLKWLRTPERADVLHPHPVPSSSFRSPELPFFREDRWAASPAYCRRSLQGDLDAAGPSPISVLPDDEQVWASVEVVDHATGPKKIDIPTGVRIPPSKRYEYYRYYGFAGCGAKTSWAHNPAKQPVQHASAAYDSAGWGYNGRRDSSSRDAKRKQYDETGRADKTPDEELLDSFGGGAFRDKMREQEEERESMAEQIALREKEQSHIAGFEAWMHEETRLSRFFTAETAADQFGVVKSSYEAVALPKIEAFEVKCADLGKPKDSLELKSEAIPVELEWGEVLVNVRAAPINPGDLYAVQMGGAGSPDACKPPFVAGNDGMGVVVKVGPGIKNLAEHDWVFPFKPGMGTWRSLTVWKEKDVLKMPVDLMPLEYAAMMRELCVAYRLLEDHGTLKPGDSVILNGANSTIGTIIIQLCRMMKLRTVALLRDSGDFEKTATWLKSLGATEPCMARWRGGDGAFSRPALAFVTPE
ncbi:hypothetical protein CYMTET_11062 [Cymbomonas tetramitiformis]|uniref:Alcohol dehydrogenase-like N-terminal domain-containing protein n=1 Tax=Cymbomonas tetramitiformis TaxID=36881 RepID=A0AAE0LDD1_9CHLO|nr:hypothetical protein CYMTET_11062 [Cymbomonas tetramitiformis]